jgi:tetratricopeptide (TPR) repeat protein
MLFKADAHADAYMAYLQALAADATDSLTLDAFVPAAVAANRETEALAWLRSSIEKYPAEAGIRVAVSKLLAATDAYDEAEAVAIDALKLGAGNGLVLEQLASIFADRRDAAPLAEIVRELQAIQPNAAKTHYYAGASSFLQGNLDEAIRLARNAAVVDSGYAAAYNLVGASHASLGHHEAARQAFQESLRLNPRDSATYVNLGLLELASENRTAAAEYFAEALSLDPESAAALEGLGRARQGGPTH